jgi:hypothetical protein
VAVGKATYQLTVAIGAALSSSFNSATSGATSKISKIGAAIKDMEKQGALSAHTLDNLKVRYNSFLGSMVFFYTAILIILALKLKINNASIKQQYVL